MLKTYGWQQKDSWNVELKPIYKKHYENNDRLPVIINLKIMEEIHKKIARNKHISMRR